MHRSASLLLGAVDPLRSPEQLITVLLGMVGTCRTLELRISWNTLNKRGRTTSYRSQNPAIPIFDYWHVMRTARLSDHIKFFL